MLIDPSAFNDVTHEILASAIEVHRTLGPGLLESIYMPCLQFELAERNRDSGNGGYGVSRITQSNEETE